MNPRDKLRLGMLAERLRGIVDGTNLDPELLAFLNEPVVDRVFHALWSSLSRLREAIELTQTCLEVGLVQVAPFWNEYPEPGTWDPHGTGNNPHVWHDVTGREWTAEDAARSARYTRKEPQPYMAGFLFTPSVRFRDPETGKHACPVVTHRSQG